MSTPETGSHGAFRRDIDDMSRHAGQAGTATASMARDAAHAARDGAEGIADGVSGAVEAAKGRLEKGSDFVKKQYDQAKETVGGAARSVKETVREHPVASVAVAVGLGVIAGMLLGRSRS